MSQTISKQALSRLIDSWIAAGTRVAGPRAIKPGVVLYQPLNSADQLLLDSKVRPGNSIKGFVFPRHERLFGYKYEGKQLQLVEQQPDDRQQVIVGALPCDAAALPILDHVFNWDFKDSLYNQRRSRTTIVTLACQVRDPDCFCTSVGLGPECTEGSDAMLYDLGDGQYEVRCLTEAGKRLFAGQTEASQRVGHIEPAAQPAVDLKAVEEFLATTFENPLWAAMSQRCLACGACAYTCPTCHCFDMVDEGNAAAGSRVRNWDACQFAMFTLHASGHNPRNVQAQRQRQRILHKFRVYREKFGRTLCTGCGNCTRNCPVGLGVRPVLEAIQKEMTKSQ